MCPIIPPILVLSYTLSIGCGGQTGALREAHTLIGEHVNAVQISPEVAIKPRPLGLRKSTCTSWCSGPHPHLHRTRSEDNAALQDVGNVGDVCCSADENAKLSPSEFAIEYLKNS